MRTIYLLAIGLLTTAQTCETTDADLDDWTTDQGDCNDADPSTYPGATETCDGADNDCNGAIDETDADGDGSSICADCDDLDPTIYPGASDPWDGTDFDCDGTVEICKVTCDNGKACGQSCIDPDKECTAICYPNPAGCACQGEK